MKKFFLELVFLWSGFFLLAAQENNNLLFTKTAAFESRPVLTMPGLDLVTPLATNFAMTAFAGSTLFFSDDNKKVIKNVLRPDAGPTLIELFFPVNSVEDQLAEIFGNILETLETGTVEHHRLGVLLAAGYELAFKERRHIKAGPFIQFKLPLMLSLAHFYLSTASRNQITTLAQEAVALTQGGSGDPGLLAALQMSGNLDDLKSFLLDKRFGPVDLRWDCFSALYKDRVFSARIGLSGNFSLDQFIEEIPDYLSVKQAGLIKFVSQGNYIADLDGMILEIMSNLESLPVRRMIGSLHEFLVKSQLASWGNNFGLVVQFGLDVVPNELQLFSTVKSTFNFGRERRRIILVEDFYQPSEFLVQTSPRLTAQVTCGLRFQRGSLQLRLGYDYFFASKESIKFVYDSHRDQDGVDYYSAGRMLTEYANTPTSKQHRVFLNLQKDLFDSNKTLVFSADLALHSKSLPTNVNFGLGLNYIF
jgi:hypothetical protein